MKKIWVFLLLFSVINHSCHSKSDPEITTENFFTALNQKDFEQAKQYATSESQEFIGMIASFNRNTKDSIDRHKQRFKVAHVHITGDSAIAEVRPVNSKTPITVHLINENGEWKIAFDKNLLMTMTMDEAKQDSMHLHDDIQKGIDSLRKEIR